MKRRVGIAMTKLSACFGVWSDQLEPRRPRRKYFFVPWLPVHFLVPHFSLRALFCSMVEHHSQASFLWFSRDHRTPPNVEVSGIEVVKQSKKQIQLI